MRELNLLAGNCRYLNGDGTGCLILCLFFRFSESPKPKEPIVVVLGSFWYSLAVTTDKEESLPIWSGEKKKKIK